jgi:NAD(P)-dependent dehydrogenase (short-subunit alcohol dehydrogenase family)
MAVDPAILDGMSPATAAPSEPVVLITGATGGLGRVVAATFAADGARLGLVGTDGYRLAAVAAACGLEADRWVAGIGDLSAPDGARAAVDAVVGRFGRIDAWLHVVGGWAGGTPVVDLDHAEVRSMLDQHLWTTLNVAQAVVPGMVERGWGRVVAVSTPFALVPGAKEASYAVGKAAEDTLIRALARELGGTGVTANLVVVRQIDTAHERETAPSTKNASSTTPEEIAATMRFLCSAAAAAVNGARVPLDGR